MEQTEMNHEPGFGNLCPRRKMTADEDGYVRCGICKNPVGMWGKKFSEFIKKEIERAKLDESFEDIKKRAAINRGTYQLD